MARGNYEKSPRQRMEWFGGYAETTLTTNTADNGRRIAQVVLSAPPRMTLSSGTINQTAFPAGIVRGESCSIARFIACLTLHDVDRRIQPCSYEVGAGLVKVQVEDDVIADPISTGGLVSPPDPLSDLRASYLWHMQTFWNPTSAGASTTAFRVQTEIDSTNSRVFESNDIMQLGVEMVTRYDTGAAPSAIDVRCSLQWRCLLRLD